MTIDHELLSHSRGSVGPVGFVGDVDDVAEISAGIGAIADRCSSCVDAVLFRLASSEAMMMTLINMRVYVEQGHHAFMGVGVPPHWVQGSFSSQSFAQRRRHAWGEIMRLCQSGVDLVEVERHE